MSFTFTIKSSAVLLMLLLVPGAAFSTAVAVPITFQFEATVNNIADTTPFDSGLEVALGDKVVGTFTFEPQIATQGQSLQVVQPFEAKFLVDGETLTTDTRSSFFTLSSLNDSLIIDFPPTSAIDVIEVFGGVGPENPDRLPNLATATSSFRMTLWGETSVLGVASFPSDPQIWNSPQFKFERTLSLNIRGNSGDVLALDAAIGDFIIVPEPSTLRVFAFPAAALFLISRRSLRQ